MLYYRFVTYEDYLKDYAEEYPDARSDVDNTEVVLSLNMKEPGSVTQEEALYHIDTEWRKVEFEGGI